MQDAWEDALRNPPVDHTISLGWLRTVLRNRHISNYRSATRRKAREEQATAPQPVPSADQIQLARQLLAQVDALPAKDRDLLVLRYWEGASLEECAERLELAPSTVRSRHARALTKLRRQLDANSGREAWLAALAPWVRVPEATGMATAGTLGLGTISLGGICAATLLWLATALDPACGIDEPTHEPDEHPPESPALTENEGVAARTTRPQGLRGFVARGPLDEDKHPCEFPISPEDSPTLAEVVLRNEAPTPGELAGAFGECTMKHGPPGDYIAPQTGPDGSVHPLLSSTMALRHVWAAMRNCHPEDTLARARVDFVIRLEADRTMLVHESAVVDSEGLDEDALACIVNTVYVAEVALRPGDATQLGLPKGTMLDIPFAAEVEIRDSLLEVVGSGFFPRGAITFATPAAAEASLESCGVGTFAATLGWDPETRALLSVAFDSDVPQETRPCLRAALTEHLAPQRQRFFPRSDVDTKLHCTFEPGARPSCEQPPLFERVEAK